MFLRQRECCFCVCVRVRNDDMKKVIFPSTFFSIGKNGAIFSTPFTHTTLALSLSLFLSLFFFSLSLSKQKDIRARRGDDEGAFSSRKSSLD